LRVAENPARTLVVDDHPAVRAGLVALLEAECGLRLLPAATGVREALAIARRETPDIALLDVALGDGDGLSLCLELKRLSTPPPGVLLYTASTDPLLGAKARLVGADGLIAKTARASELRSAIQTALQGRGNPPAFDRELLRAITARLAPETLSLVGLRLEGTPITSTAEVLGLDEEGVISRIRALLRRLGDDSAAATVG